MSETPVYKRAKLNHIHDRQESDSDSTPRCVSLEEWIAARKEILAQEKQLSREYDAVVQARRNMPWLKIEKEYTFETDSGEKSLTDLFNDRDNLIVYHMMYGDDDVSPCSICSYFIDGYDGQHVHIAANGASIVVTSPASLSKLTGVWSTKAWSIPKASCSHDFCIDFRVEANEEQKATKEKFYNFGNGWFPCPLYPGISVFTKKGDDIYLTYQAQSRGLDVTNAANHLFDMLPTGRNGFSAKHKEDY